MSRVPGSRSGEEAAVKILKSLLKAAIYVMDQSSDQVERASDRVSDFAARGRKAFYPEEDHTLRSVLSFAAGLGVGIGAAVLLAPVSGAEMRNFIGEKVHDMRNKVRERFSEDRDPAGTGRGEQ
jgi:hypothetical protein